MKNKFLKLAVSKLLIACLVFSSVAMAFAATVATTTDIKGHWAETQISAWIEKGFIKGYEDNSFKPNNSITRAEFMALVNRSFGFTDEAQISFTDIASSNWAYADVARGVKAGYIKGYPDGTVGAGKTISRQEVAVIVDRLLNLPTATAPSTFSDGSTIGLWAKDAVDSAVSAGILNGYAIDNTFKPANPISRAESVVTLDRALAPKVVVYDKPGTYGPVTGTEIVNQDVVINIPGVTLQNMTINGKLTFAAGIGIGDATLKNVTVKGETIVQGGGVNSIHFQDSTLATVTVDKAPALGSVRIVAEGTTTVNQVNVNSPVTLQETNETGAGFGNVTLTDKLPAGSIVTLKGTFDKVVVNAAGIHLTLAEGSIKELTFNATAAGSTLELASGTTVTNLILYTVTIVTGKGTITTVTESPSVQAGGKQTFETPPTTIVVGTETPTPTPTPTPGTTTPGGGTNPPSGCTSNCGTTQQNGTVTGFVYDNNNVALSGAAVSATVTGSTYYSTTTANDGSFLISSVPVGSISSLTVTQNAYQSVTYNTYSVTANTNTPIGIVHLTPNVMLSAATVTGNTYMNVTFSQGVYGNSAHNTPIASASFNLTLSSGNASSPSIQGITKTDGSPLVGGETTVRIYFTVSGIRNINTQKITVTPSSGTSIYNNSGGATSIKETLITNY